MKSRSDEARAILNKLHPATGNEQPYISSLIFEIDSSSPWLRERLSPDVSNNPTLADLLIMISAAYYRRNMPHEFLVEDDTSLRLRSLGHMRAPTLEEFRNRMLETLVSKPGGITPDLEDFLSHLARLMTTLPNTIETLEDLKNGKPISKQRAAYVLDILEWELNAIISQIVDADITPEQLENMSFYRETSRIVNTLGEMTVEELKNKKDQLLPAYMNENDFEKILGAQSLRLQKLEEFGTGELDDQTMIRFIRAREEAHKIVFDVVQHIVEQKYTLTANDLAQTHSGRVDNHDELQQEKTYIKNIINETKKMFSTLGLNVNQIERGL